MWECQARLLILFVMFTLGSITIGIEFLIAAGIVLVISVLLGYKKEGW